MPRRPSKPQVSKRRSGVHRLLLLLLVLGGGLVLYGVFVSNRRLLPNGMVPDRTMSASGASGETLARLVCATCHLFPEPNLLDQRTWNNFVLPKMKVYLGLAQLSIEKPVEAELIKATGVFPTNPVIDLADFDKIAHYYLTQAPETRVPQPPKPPVQIGLNLFRVEQPKFRRTPPLTTLVAIDAAEHRIYTADATTQTLDMWNPAGDLIDSIRVGNIAVDLNKTERGLYLTTIGHFFPAEERRGQVILLEHTAGGFQRKVLLSDLARPTHLAFGDFNGDGKMDFVLCQFGYFTGCFSWFENLGNEQYQEHVIINKSGAIRSVVKDFNGDGKSDIAVLMGQEIESLVILENNGKGEFTPRPVFQTPPSYGHSYFEVVDFNKDGLPDFLVTNGDNGDYESAPKSYHGIRLYLNQGGGRFKEAFFYPLNGAYKAVVRDFNEDGLMDIAAISFFPDYPNALMESFVYLENQGGLRFSAYTFPECNVGRWLTMDVGDLDGDGDLDLVLGSLIRMPTEVPLQIKEHWEKNGPSILILRNNLR